MGSCLAKNKVKTQKIINKGTNQTKKIQQTKQTPQKVEKYRIRDSPQQKRLIFGHSPLNYCPFLFSKFKNSDGTPEQVTLGFMLSRCQIDAQKGQISLSLINCSLIKIWVVYGGVQKISETGLTVQIDKYTQLKQFQTEKRLQNNEQGESLPKFQFRQSLDQQILIILEPLLSPKQTMYMIYRYQILPNEKQYSLIVQTFQWNSLSFRISDIYGSQYLFKVNDQNENCSVCLTNKSQCILLPCRHMCICQICLQQIQKVKPNCPLCRKQYYSVIKYIQKQQSESIVIS